MHLIWITSEEEYLTLEKTQNHKYVLLDPLHSMFSYHLLLMKNQIFQYFAII